MQIDVKKFADQNKSEIENEFEPSVKPASRSNDSLTPLQVIFEAMMQDTEYVYSGDYLCWFNRRDHYFIAIDTT